jgi:glycosyltransferase involved in cell wall biosynthesis
MRILHAIHDFLPRHRAGSEIYAYELAQQLVGRGHELHLLCAEYDPSRSHGSLTWRFYDDLPVTELVNNWVFSTLAESYESPHIAAQLEHVLRAVQPDLIHIHNLLNLSHRLPEIAGSLGIPSVATLHEYVLVCASGGQRLHLAEHHICHEIDCSRCARCFSQSPFYAQMAFSRISQSTAGMSVGARMAGYFRCRFPRLFARLGRSLADLRAGPTVTEVDIEERLAAARSVFSAIDLFVAPSQALADDFMRFGLPADKILVSDYGFAPMPEAARAPDRSLRIGFVGTLSWHKGVHILVEAVRKLPADRYRLEVFGSLDTFPDYVAELSTLAAGLPVSFHGGFERQEAAEIYAQIDLLVVASLWPENSPLVIHEAFMAGLPVVGSRIGGTADLISHGENGLLYEYDSADDLAAALQRLIDQPELVERFRESLPEVKSIAEDAAEWEQRYQGLLDSRRAGS